MSNTTEKLTGYQLLKNQNEELITENSRLSQKVKDLWAQSEAKEKDAQMYSKELEALKSKLEALNAQSRDNLLKKNFELEQIEILKKENEALIQKVGGLNEIKESTSLENLRLKSENENLNGTISGLQKKVQEFNEFKTVQEKVAKEKETVLNSVNVELAKLKNENAIYKEAQSKESRKMYAFMVVVSILAIFANFTHVGAKYLSLIDSPTILNEITCYGSMLVFDLAVFLFTIKGKENAAISFAIGVFLIVFMQLGSPFVGAGLSAEYAEKIIAGLIYSGMFAFIPYKLSQLFTKK